MYYCMVPGKDENWIGMAKKEPFTGETPDPITEPGELWFRYGESRTGAFCNITDEMIALGLETSVVFCDGGEGGA